MKRFNKLFLTVVISLVLILFPLASVASAGRPNSAENYQYLVGAGAICSLEPSACPDISEAPNGDRIEITGQGTFNTSDKTVTGGGTFTHKDKDGNVLGTGTWIAQSLISFRSYGSGVPQGTPPEFEGGRAKMKIMLTSSTGLTFEAKLRIDCLLGDPPAGAEEGVELTVHRAPNFHDSVSGDTLLIREP